MLITESGSGDGADILNTDLARTFGDPTMTSKEQNKMKNSKSATGIFRSLFRLVCIRIVFTFAICDCLLS